MVNEPIYLKLKAHILVQMVKAQILVLEEKIQLRFGKVDFPFLLLFLFDAFLFPFARAQFLFGDSPPFALDSRQKLVLDPIVFSKSN